MLIDWFTVGAQIVNFLILVWLLKRFLYKPILDAIDAREKRIAAKLEDADTKKAAAEEQRDAFQRKSVEFDEQRAALMSKVSEEVKTERQQLLDEARQATQALTSKRMQTLRIDATNLSQAISHAAQHEVFSIARKALSDLATVSLEERFSEVFTRRLREMDASAKAVLAKVLNSTPDAALVRSAFELPMEQRTAIQNALNETFATDVRVRFEVAPELVCGIELTANGQQLAWSISGYLASLENRVGELLNEQAKTDVPAPAPEEVR